MPPQETHYPFDHPTFADAKLRLELKEGDLFFFVDSKGKILQGKVRKSGLTPECDFPYEHGGHSSYMDYLKPGKIWGKTEEEVREKLAQQQHLQQGQSVEASSETQALAIPDTATTTAVISLEQRLAIQRSTKDAIVWNDKGGIDLRDIQAAAMDLTIRIAHPISAFGAESMEKIVAEGFINPIIYRVLKKEFDALFDKIKDILSALTAVQTLPEPAVNAMRQGLYGAANALVLQFLERHAELIEFTQLASVTKGNFAAKALLAIVDDGTKHLKDLPDAARELVDRFRQR